MRLEKGLTIRAIKTGFLLRNYWEEPTQYKTDYKDNTWTFDTLSELLSFVKDNEVDFLKE